MMDRETDKVGNLVIIGCFFFILFSKIYPVVIHQDSSNEYPQHVLQRNTDTYAYNLNYQMPSLSASLDQIQNVSKIENRQYLFFFIYLFLLD